MSARILIKKETLVKGAIKIIRDKGIEELSARNLAKVCNCSTQPIFRLFEKLSRRRNSRWWNHWDVIFLCFLYAFF